MNKDFSYKGFSGSCETSIEDECLHGRILFIEDIITYEGQTIAEIRAAFEAAVDGYLELCSEEGLEPNKPFSGSFNVRVGAMRHRACALAARRAGLSMNEFVTNAIDDACQIKTNETTVKHLHTHVHVVEKEYVGTASTSGNTAGWSNYVH